jgi:hypothetical protein
MLYGLNGYDLELINVANELIAHHNRLVEDEPAGLVRVNLPNPLDEDPPLLPPPWQEPVAAVPLAEAGGEFCPEARRPGPTFEELFRKRRGDSQDG